MINNKDKHKERMKQSKFIPKPKSDWFDQNGNPIGMGLHQLQKKTF